MAICGLDELSVMRVSIRSLSGIASSAVRRSYSGIVAEALLLVGTVP